MTQKNPTVPKNDLKKISSKISLYAALAEVISEEVNNGGNMEHYNLCTIAYYLSESLQKLRLEIIDLRTALFGIED